MQLAIHQIDAFTNELFKGNYAAVIPLESWLSDDLMLKIGAENNVSETAFTYQQDDGSFVIRWFSPLMEIDFCGHATLAAAYVLCEEHNISQIRFVADAVGELIVNRNADGSFAMTENSLATAVLEDIPVIVFILNNYSLGMVAQWQRTFYDRRMIGVDQQNCPDYVKLAESYGAQGIRAQSMDELHKAIKTALSSDVATVIDIPIDPVEDVLPFVAPGTSLADMVLPS